MYLMIIIIQNEIDLEYVIRDKIEVVINFASRERGGAVR
jgi:hypothetical protein